MQVTPSTDDQLMCTAAMRYCLGRSSYIVGACLDWLKATWDQFSPNTQWVILRDIIEALMDDQKEKSYKVEWYSSYWKNFADQHILKLDALSLKWLRDSLVHKIAIGEKFPLDYNLYPEYQTKETVDGTP